MTSQERDGRFLLCVPISLKMSENSSCAVSSPTPKLLNFSCIGVYEVVMACDLNLHFPITDGIGNFSCLLAIWICFVVK